MKIPLGKPGSWRYRLVVWHLRTMLHIVCFFTGDDPAEIARLAYYETVRRGWEEERKKEKK